MMAVDGTEDQYRFGNLFETSSILFFLSLAHFGRYRDATDSGKGHVIRAAIIGRSSFRSINSDYSSVAIPSATEW